jgi:hypothetical protein
MKSTSKRKKMGRPATGVTPMRGVRISDDLCARVETWAAKQSDVPSFSEAVRRLLERALTRNGK